MLNKNTSASQANKEAPGAAPDAVAIHGFQQVLEMLRIADPAFRESLLRRLAARDVQLAKTLRNDLAELGL
ncbi:MAG: hypothetical protein NDJ89_09915 [Oligoflexia bacterium]|nr:hypothetical protein [Oligoflexia bacterium]